MMTYGELEHSPWLVVLAVEGAVDDAVDLAVLAELEQDLAGEDLTVVAVREAG